MKQSIPAFPFQSVDPKGAPNAPEIGMTLRDYFAIYASNEDILEMQRCKPEGYISRECARYMIADAMLEQREKE